MCTYCICGHIEAESFMFVKRKREKGERKWDSREIRLLIGYGSQFSSLPLPITKRRYNSKGGGIEDREKTVNVVEGWV